MFREYYKIRKIVFVIVLVAFPGHTVTWFAYILFGRKIIFDAFVSLYNSEVEDRRTVSKRSFSALYYWFLDWISCTLASKILLDTNAHIAYFVKKYHISAEKFTRVFVGTTSRDFYPAVVKNTGGKFIVHFHGTFIPLQGIEYIVRAAKLLEHDKDIVFRIIGSGQEYARVQALVRKEEVHDIVFIPRVSLSDLRAYIQKADVCLGIFGDTVKSRMVIPNKIYEALACKKPVITQKSDAIKELLIDQESVLLCGGGDAQDLAEKILLLKNDVGLREKIAVSGYDIFIRELQPSKLVQKIM
mgnify:FL=1